MGRPKAGSPDARGRLLEAAGRGFRVGGFGGVGVDGLAKEAGLTSGAFYAHFGSKAEAFRLALIDGLAFLRGGVERFQAEHGPAWKDLFVDFYFGPRLEVALDEACALPTLSTDAARADLSTRQAYEVELRLLAETIARGLPGEGALTRAWQLLSILSGAAAMARAVDDASLRADIVAAATRAAKAV